MCADMTLQQPRSAEALAAVLALAALVVRAHVHAVSGHGNVHFVAMRALPGLLVADAAVRLAVTRQVARCAVPLAAFGADVVLFNVNLVPGGVHENIEIVIELGEGLEIIGVVDGLCPGGRETAVLERAGTEAVVRGTVAERKDERQEFSAVALHVVVR